MSNKTIPSNYNAMDGKVRNIVETVILDGIYIFVIYLTGLSLRVSMYLALGMIPISAFAIMGMDGQSLLQALFNLIRFKKRKRILSKPSQEYIREKNKAIMLKKQKEAAIGKRK